MRDDERDCATGRRGAAGASRPGSFASGSSGVVAARRDLRAAGAGRKQRGAEAARQTVTAVSVEASVAISVGIQIATGDVEPAAARTASCRSAASGGTPWR